jgi:hypothetical protein
MQGEVDPATVPDTHSKWWDYWKEYWARKHKLNPMLEDYTARLRFR